jgi:hypothetical protein
MQPRHRTPALQDSAPDATSGGHADIPLTHEDIIALAKRLGRPASSLIVLARGNDPFYLQPARQAKARWFKEVWDLLQPDQGVHLRRLHYAIVSREDRPRKPDGFKFRKGLGPPIDRIGRGSRGRFG